MPEFGARGEKLWADLGVSEEFSPAGVLAVEACRMADRLDWLDRDPLCVQEARLTAVALKALLESPALRRSERQEASAIDALAARRAARRSAASGS